MTSYSGGLLHQLKNFFIKADEGLTRGVEALSNDSRGRVS